MKKRIFAALLCVIMLFGMLPITALAAEPKTIYVDATEGNDKNNGSKDLPYATVEKAVTEAESGDTIQLGKGNYTLYGVSSTGHTKGKDLTFVGLGADKTAWNIVQKFLTRTILAQSITATTVSMAQERSRSEI